MTAPEPTSDSDTTETTPASSADAGASEHAESVADAAAGKEAAKYRRQLREVEAERDTLRSAVDTFRRQQVEDIAARQFNVSKPAAVWASGVTVDALLGPDGTLDQKLVAAAITAAVTDLGLHVPKPSGLPAAPNAGRESLSRGATWSDFLKHG